MMETQYEPQQYYGANSSNNYYNVLDAHHVGSSNEQQHDQLRPMVLELGGPSFNPKFIPESSDRMMQRLYDLLNAAEHSVYEGSSYSQQSVVSRLMSIKADYNLSNNCFDEITNLFKEVLPQVNSMTGSFYETKKLVQGMGLPVEEIDYCMIFWREDSVLTKCKFCKKTKIQGYEEWCSDTRENSST